MRQLAIAVAKIDKKPEHRSLDPFRRIPNVETYEVGVEKPADAL